MAKPVPIQSQLLQRNGPTSVGRDAAAVAATSGLGAAVGAAAGWGRGAAIGPGAGAAAGIMGVLLTRGYPTVVEPETLLTFQVTASLTIETNNAPQAFRFVDIGLPTLNGIEAARQIRQLCPESKIIVVSQESDADIVQDALSFGTLAYLVKTMAGCELLTAIKAARGGRLFVGGQLSSPCSC
jgi:CheY-like chemotaxis protein